MFFCSLLFFFFFFPPYIFRSCQKENYCLRGDSCQARRLCCFLLPAAYHVSISKLERVALCHLAENALRRRSLSPTVPRPPNKKQTNWHAEVLGRAAVKPFPVSFFFFFAVLGSWSPSKGLSSVWLFPCQKRRVQKRNARNIFSASLQAGRPRWRR